MRGLARLYCLLFGGNALRSLIVAFSLRIIAIIGIEAPNPYRN